MGNQNIIYHLPVDDLLTNFLICLSICLILTAEEIDSEDDGKTNKLLKTKNLLKAMSGLCMMGKLWSKYHETSKDVANENHNPGKLNRAVLVARLDSISKRKVSEKLYWNK